MVEEDEEIAKFWKLIILRTGGSERKFLQKKKKSASGYEVSEV